MASSSKSKSTPNQKLILTTTSLHNVVIANRSDVIYYEIVTPKWEKDLTRISRLDPNSKQYDLICEFLNEHDKPVSVRLYGGVTTRAEEFLVKDESAGTAKFRGKDGKMYTWRVDHDELELFREDQPVAWYHRQKRYLGLLRMSQHPYLEIDSMAMDTLDSLIVSFLLVERRRRDGKI
ncbi:hypothetical protein QCA50_007590 [Cerrena zonata]|uniref:DUF6593 domain-containing protein n=1 Tax=Cerrena zonata TaxID=2478898 RepID=A0AAW0GGB6_9APHY